jgi:hypothetical protein
MSDGEVQHQIWTHKELGEQRRSIILQWPFVLEQEFDGVRSIFVHYARFHKK